jgi:hypothetical protein
MKVLVLGAPRAASAKLERRSPGASAKSQSTRARRTLNRDAVAWGSRGQAPHGPQAL